METTTGVSDIMFVVVVVVIFGPLNKDVVVRMGFRPGKGGFRCVGLFAGEEEETLGRGLEGE